MADVPNVHVSTEDHDDTPAPRRTKKARCRTGCWNCRRRRKKCNGRRPTCETCSHKGEICEWGLKLSFRPENNYSIPATHPSMRQVSFSGRDTAIEFYDITHEIIRDYQTEARFPEDIRRGSEQYSFANYVGTSHDSLSNGRPRISWEQNVHVSSPGYSPYAGVTVRPSSPDGFGVTFGFNRPGSDSPLSVNSAESFRVLRSAAAQLLDLGGPPPSAALVAANDEYLQPTATSIISPTATGLSEYSNYDDGIFLPGSTYRELHSTLRNRIFDTARSTYSSRVPSPGLVTGEDDTTDNYSHVNDGVIFPRPEVFPSASFTPLFAELEWQEEYKLWKNWVDEIAPWLDKFDGDCHFGRTLPDLAQSHRHLRCSMLALSARQQERKYPDRRSSASLVLYQEAVHQLIPQLQTKSTAVVASCVVLCVLEMMSCSPNMWRRHLDGCASLIQSVGINGFSSGLEKALFWCFARMDVCGGLISSQQTLIPINNWSSEMSLEGSIRLYREISCYGLYADYAVFLCALALELFAGNYAEATFAERWTELFAYIEDWYNQRPSEMKSIFELNSPKGDYSQPFPIVLFSNPAAVSGNQLYHTAALLMLQKKPRGASVRSKPRSILWHARRICAISISNTQHACWTNSIQPLWIAGKVMSHPSEHQAILDIYATIEKDVGWGAKWRADDLRSYWGDLDD